MYKQRPLSKKIDQEYNIGGAMRKWFEYLKLAFWFAAANAIGLGLIALLVLVIVF